MSWETSTISIPVSRGAVPSRIWLWPIFAVDDTVLLSLLKNSYGIRGTTAVGPSQRRRSRSEDEKIPDELNYSDLPCQDVQHQVKIAGPLVGSVHRARAAGRVVAPPVHYARHGVYEGVITHAPVYELVELGPVIPPPLVVGLEGLDPVKKAGDPLELLELV